MLDTIALTLERDEFEVVEAFSKYGGSMGTAGSVAFQFKHVGQLIFAPGTDEDRVMEVALEAGAARGAGCAEQRYADGSPTHPGGGIMGAPGRIAALEVLKSVGRR